MDTGVTQAMIDGEEPLTPRHIYSCVPLCLLRLHLLCKLRARYWVCVQCDAGAEDDCGEAKERQVRRSQGSSGTPFPSPVPWFGSLLDRVLMLRQALKSAAAQTSPAPTPAPTPAADGKLPGFFS